MGVCSLSSPLSPLRNVWFHIVFFFCRRRSEGQESSATKSLSSIPRKPIEILLTFEKRFYRKQFSFFIILIFRLTEQFEVFCLSEIEKT